MQEFKKERRISNEKVEEENEDIKKIKKVGIPTHVPHFWNQSLSFFYLTFNSAILSYHLFIQYGESWLIING